MGMRYLESLKNKSDHLHIRINRELKLKAEIVAKNESRSLSNLVIKLIEDYLKK